MATRSMIGKLNADGKTVTAIYCHWDGYLEHNGRLLVENYPNATKADELMNVGDISSLGKTTSECDAYSNKGEIGTEARLLNVDEFSTDWQIEYAYLFMDGEWHYKSHTLEDWTPLKRKYEQS